MTLVTITPATVYPVTISKAKAALRVTSSALDVVVDDAIKQATAQVESFLNRRLMPCTVEQRLDCFPAHCFELGVDPIRALTSVRYDASDGTLDVLLASTKYQTDLQWCKGRIRPAEGEAWPDTARRFDAVRIRMEAGYANVESIPQNIVTGLLLTVEQIVDGCDNQAAIDSFLWPHRLVPV